MQARTSGILLHITSLPSRYGIGDFGPEAYRFVDLLVRARQSYWQMLPLTPPRPRPPYSPYNCLSAFAGNTLFISPELLYRQGLLARKDIQHRPTFPEGRVDYRLVATYKTKLLNLAFERFKAKPREPDYELFCAKNRSWLNSFAGFVALRQHFQPRLWWDWPKQLRDGNKKALQAIGPQLKDTIEKYKFFQYLFFEQWFALKHYCNKRGIQIIGDIPIYVAYDSADVWAHPKIFKLTSTRKRRALAGVPPDLFSRTGQLWGNPVYDWRALKNTGYSWWIQRIRHNLTLFDIVRLDHFRGFVKYWQVPAGHKTAKDGKWVNGPKDDFFNKLFRAFPAKPVIIEDLGYITKEVRALAEKLQLPCMKVLQFAFDAPALVFDKKTRGPTNPHCLANHVKNCVVYTGTHDNNTARGWFEKEARPEQKKKLYKYLGHKVAADDVHWEMIRLAMTSVGNLLIIPMQDVLGLGQQARMNHPGTVKGNWTWRLQPGRITAPTIKKLTKLTQTYGRARNGAGGIRTPATFR
jgi:4-alpha-glucanotransferase